MTSWMAAGILQAHGLRPVRLVRRGRPFWAAWPIDGYAEEVPNPEWSYTLTGLAMRVREIYRRDAYLRT